MFSALMALPGHGGGILEFFKSIPLLPILGAALAAVLLTALLWTVPAAAACAEHRLDSGTLTVEPTCTTIGVMTFSCTNPGCEYRVTQKVGNLGHRIGSDGLCTRCGLREDGTAPAEPAAPAPIQAAVETPAEPPAEERPAEKLPAAPADRAQSQTVSAPAARTALLPWAVLVLTVLCASGALLLARRLRRG